MKPQKRLHLEIQTHRRQVYGLIRSSYREGGRVKHTTHGRITGMSLAQLKLLQAAFRGDVMLKSSPDALRVRMMLTNQNRGRGRYLNRDRKEVEWDCSSASSRC